MSRAADGVPAELLGDTDEQVVCRECGEALGQITHSHLSMHGMTTDEYRGRYPDAPFQPDRVKEAGGWTDRHDEAPRLISDSIRRKHERGDYE